MSEDAVQFLAKIILRMDQESLVRLRNILEENYPGDETGVGAVIPPNLPLKEDGVEVPFEDWPEEYWESQA